MIDPDGASIVKHGRLMHRKKYRFKKRPYKHQVAAIKKALPQLKKTGGFALLMEPRTGKTKTAVDIASILHEAEKVSRVLILCPLGVMDVWKDEIKANCPAKFRITMWDRRGRKRVDLPAWGNSTLDFVIMNPDAFSTPGKVVTGRDGRKKRSRTRGGRYDIRNALHKWQPQLIITDESHRFKTPSSRKTRLWLSPKIRDVAQYRLILTGTIQTKKKRAADVYVQVKHMNPKSPLVVNHTLETFKSEYSVYTNRNGYEQWIKNRNMNRMRKLLHDEAYSITRRDAFGPDVRLPDQIVPIELTGHTRELYEAMALEMIAKIKTGEITEASIRLVQNLRLAQITSGLAKTTPTDEHPDARLLRVGRDKLDALEDLCADWFEAGEHVIVGARFRGDISGVRGLMRKLRVPCFEVHGAIKSQHRTNMWKSFNLQRGPACFIGQPQASSLGIDLRSAAIVVWFSLTNSWVDFEQFEQRNALNPDPRSYVYLLSRGTIDYLLYQSLQEDGEIGRLVMKAPEKLWVPE